MIYTPRSYQGKFLGAMGMPGHHDGYLRAALPWHRRAGKDKTVLSFTAEAMKWRVGTYYYFLPTYTQAKKVIWDGIDGTGSKFTDVWQDGDILAKHETEMKITLRHPDDPEQPGSIVQLIGGDNIDTVVGTNPVGCIYSEYPLMTPRAWDLVEPILAENLGWAVFIFTPRGKNHAHSLWKAAKQDPEWYTDLRTIEDTFRDAPGEARFGQPVVTLAQIDKMRARGMAEELIQQEFYCSFDGAMVGAYYADQLSMLDRMGRITEVPYDPMFPVDTAWDLGLDDAMSIWFTQTIGGMCRVIEYQEGHTKGLDWYAAELRKKPYRYGEHYAPHDIKVHELTSGNSRIEISAEMGIHFQPQPKLAVQDGIQATRRLLPLCAFDAKKCERGLDGLRSYRREWDEKMQCWKDNPVHDWASNPADALRTRAVAWQGNLQGGTQGGWAETRYDVWRAPHEQQQADASPKGAYSRRYARGEGMTQTHAEIEHAKNWWGD